MDDLPVFLQMFVRLLAVFALGASLLAMAPRKSEKPAADRAPRVEKADEQAAAKVCPHPAPPPAADPAR
ncbi:MAG TPA: hypothetical protein VGM73_08170 [Candidatus Didemnitutus sp.]|jgi:hypothetical protein